MIGSNSSKEMIGSFANSPGPYLGLEEPKRRSVHEEGALSDFHREGRMTEMVRGWMRKDGDGREKEEMVRVEWREA